MIDVKEHAEDFFADSMCTGCDSRYAVLWEQYSVCVEYEADGQSRMFSHAWIS